MRRSLAASTALIVAALVGGSLSAPVEAAPTAGKAKAVTLESLPAKSEVGKKLTLRGKVKGDPAKVKIQRKYARGSWVTVARTESNGKGKYKVKVPLVQGGTTSFRALKGKQKSQVRSLAVYQWLDIVDQPHVVGGDLVVDSPNSRIGGRTFPKSLEFVNNWSGFSGGVGIKTGRTCARFETFTGFLDDERAGLPDDAVQQLTVQRVTAAGAPIGGALGWETPAGPAVRRVVNLTGAEYMIANLGVDSATPPSSDVTAVLGRPRAYCNSAGLPVFDPDVLMSKQVAKRSTLRWSTR